MPWEGSSSIMELILPNVPDKCILRSSMLLLDLPSHRGGRHSLNYISNYKFSLRVVLDKDYPQ